MSEVRIQVSENGPYVVFGAVSLVDHEGSPVPVEKSVYALCRCGHSKTKPFCDGSHSAVGFRGGPEPAGE